MIKYQTSTLNTDINIVEMVSETDTTMDIKGDTFPLVRVSKTDPLLTYWDTWQDAHKDILRRNLEAIEKLEAEIAELTR